MTAGPKPGSETTNLKFIYDAWNRMVKVTDNSDATIAEYRYDGLGRRIRKYTDPVTGNWTVREYYYNSAWQVLEIRKETKSRSGTPPAPVRLIRLGAT